MTKEQSFFNNCQQFDAGMSISATLKEEQKWKVG